MSIPVSILGQRAAVTRLSNTLTTAATFPFTNITTYSGKSAFVQLEVATLTSPVTIALTGELNGTPQTENVIVGTSKVIRSTKQWTKVTQVASASTTATACTAKAIYSTGEPATTATTLYSALPCRLGQPTLRRTLFALVPGGVQLAAALILYTNADDLAIGDRVTVGEDVYEVENPNPVFDRTQFHHAEAALKRLRAA